MLGARSPSLQKEANNMSAILKAWLNKWSLGWFSRHQSLRLTPYANYLIDTDACTARVRLGLLYIIFINYDLHFVRYTNAGVEQEITFKATKLNSSGAHAPETEPLK